MKRWKKVLLITGCSFGGLILLILLAGPAIIGAVAESQIVSIVKEQTQADVTIGGVSFSWSGRVRIDDFRLVPKNCVEPLVDVKRIDATIALGSAIGGKYIADVEVVAPRILVEKGADGKFNYDFPPSPPKEPKRSKPGGKDEKAFVQANLRIKDGEVRIRGRGRETFYRNLAVTAKIDTLDKPITYDIALDTVKVNGAIDINTISGPATLVLDRFSLKNLTGAARAYSGVAELDGSVTGSLDYQIQGAPRFGGKGKLEINDFAAVIGDKTVKLDRVAFTHDGGIDEKGSGRQVLTIVSGKALGATATVDVHDALGKSPLVRVDLRAVSDLGELARVLEKVIGLKQDMTLEGSAQLLGKVEATGTEWAKATLAVATRDLVAVDTKEGKKYDVDKSIDLTMVGGWDGKTKTASADVLSLKSSFATIDGKGGAALAGESPEIKQSSFQLEVDLEKLGTKLALFMAAAPLLRGTVAANASYAGDRYSLDATVKGMKIGTTGPIDATVAQKGVFSPAKGGGFKIETGVVTSSAADLKVTGEIRNVMEERREGEIRLEAVARPVELSKWISDLNLGGPEIRMTGVASLKPKVVTLTGQTQLSGLTMTSKDGKGATVTRTAKTGIVEFAVTRTDPDILATLKTSTFEWSDPSATAKGSLESQVTYNGKGTTGTTRISNLEVTDEKKNVAKDPGVTIVHDIGLADRNRTIDLKKVEVASSFLNGAITGRILRVDPALEFQKVHLAFQYIPERLGTIAKAWIPGKLEGSEEKVLDITLDGTAASSQVLAILRGTTGAIEVDLAKFTTEGLSVSGRTRLDLKGGKLVSGTPLSVNKGRTDLHASLDFNGPEKKPQSTIEFNAKDVDANGQMGPLLEMINPIFHTAGVDAKVDGQIQSDFKLLWTGPLDPGEKDWVAAASKSLSGSGVFGVQNLNIAGSPAVGQIMSAIGQGNALQGEIIATQIRIENGRFRYENMTLRGSRKDPAVLKRDQDQLATDRQQLEADRPQLQAREHTKRLEELRQREEDLPFRYTFRFSGSVGFDKTLQLRVLMPMTPNMIKAHPNLQKYIGTSFWVDLTGRTDNPRLDLSKMIGESVKRAAEGILMDKLDDALKRLLDKKKKDEKK